MCPEACGQEYYPNNRILGSTRSRRSPPHQFKPLYRLSLIAEARYLCTMKVARNKNPIEKNNKYATTTNAWITRWAKKKSTSGDLSSKDSAIIISSPASHIFSWSAAMAAKCLSFGWSCHRSGGVAGWIQFSIGVDYYALSMRRLAWPTKFTARRESTRRRLQALKVETAALPLILCDEERKRAIIVFHAEDCMSCDERIAQSWVMRDPGQAGANTRSGIAPSCFHAVGLGTHFRFFTCTEIVVASFADLLRIRNTLATNGGVALLHQ
jgi:hypothetical protein